MKPVIYLSQYRRLSLHMALIFVYLIVFLIRNWEVGEMSTARLLTLIPLGGAGVGIAYLVRYATLLAVRLHRVGSALLLFFGGMVIIGVLGYVLFHVVSNFMADEVVNTPEEHPWKDYGLFYLGWYVNYAKYGIIFFFAEELLFQRWDKLFASWGENHIPEGATALVSVDGGAMSTFDGQTVTVPAKVIRLVHQINTLLGFRPEEPSKGVFFSKETPAESPPPLSEPPEPEHVTINWILDFLNVGRSTFYRCIRNQILFEVCRIGNRPYYLKKEVTALMIRHDKGCWTFSKYLKEQQKRKT